MPALLLICYSPALGGAERVLLSFARGLADSEPSGALAAAGPVETWLACPEGPIADRARADGMRVVAVRERSLRLRTGRRDRVLALARLAGHRRELTRLIAALDPDLVVVNGMRSAIALAHTRAVRGGAPLVFLHHDLLPGAAIGAAVRLAARRANLVIVPSHVVAADLGLDCAPLVIHPGVDVEQFAADTSPASPPEVLTLGALAGWKRVDFALEVIALVRRRLPQARLRVAGSAVPGDPGQTLVELRERAAREDLAGAVEFLGEVADPRLELARASCLLHCAEREPFGLAVLEALAAARPVVAPDAGGPREIVDPSCGILYPPGDAGAAAAAIVALIGDPGLARAMGARGRARVQERFGVRRARAAFVSAVTALPARCTEAGAAGASGARAPAPALVTVTHNSERALDALLHSVARHLGSARVFVVDNASNDGTLAVADRWRGRLAIETLALRENIGFGAACNRGVALVGEPVTALLNPDVELVDNSLLALAAEAARADAPARLLAPLVLRGDGRREKSAHQLPCSAAELVHALVPPAALCDRAAAVIAPWRSNHARPVGWAVGCALLARTHTLRRLGPFDQSIFLYGEDLDLCLRAREQAVATWFWPSARVLHHGAHSTGPAFGGEPFERLAAARHNVVAQRLGRRAALADGALQAFTFASRLTLKRALGRECARERSRLAALLAVTLGEQSVP
ncbi:MAG: glycosyltransferase [Solirubrobacteraceae bacterium]